MYIYTYIHTFLWQKNITAKNKNRQTSTTNSTRYLYNILNKYDTLTKSLLNH